MFFTLAPLLMIYNGDGITINTPPYGNIFPNPNNDGKILGIWWDDDLRSKK